MSKKNIIYVIDKDCLKVLIVEAEWKVKAWMEG
jgi:hypothetical protein